MTTPRDTVLHAETNAQCLPGDDERFSGWGLMGLTFASGDVLGTRRFPAASIGDGYSSVWHRDPAGDWTFYADAAPEFSCTRYFGSAVAKAVQSPVTLEWTSDDALHIETAGGQLSCDLTVEKTVASRAMNLIASAFPERAWRSPRMLGLTSVVAGPMLRAGKLALAGTVPNGQEFIANPRKIWVVKEARLSVGGRVETELAPLEEQARLGDFRIPQRGLLAVGNAAFEPLDASRHSTRTSAAT